MLFFFLLLLKRSLWYGYTMICFSIYLLMNIWIISSFWVFWIKAVKKRYMQVYGYMLSVFMGKLPRRGIVNKCKNSFIRNCQSVSQKGCVILHSHQWCMGIPAALDPHQHLLLSVFLISHSSGTVRGSHCSCHLHLENVEHVFMCLLAFLYIFFCEVSKSLANFVFLLLTCKSSSYILDTIFC